MLGFRYRLKKIEQKAKVGRDRITIARIRNGKVTAAHTENERGEKEDLPNLRGLSLEDLKESLKQYDGKSFIVDKSDFHFAPDPKKDEEYIFNSSDFVFDFSKEKEEAHSEIVHVDRPEPDPPPVPDIPPSPEIKKSKRNSILKRSKKETPVTEKPTPAPAPEKREQWGKDFWEYDDENDQCPLISDLARNIKKTTQNEQGIPFTTRF